MRDLLTMVERPSYSQHFSVDGPFYENPAPTFSFIGTALVSLSTVARGVAASCQVPIMCPYTMEALGSCRVSFRLADALDGPDISGRGTPEPKAPNSFPPSLPISSDGRLSFTVVVDAVRGVSSEDFATVHAQVKLSSIVGPGIDAEDTLLSHPVDPSNLSLSHLQLRKVISVNPTADTAAYMREGYASIEFFAKVRPAYLSRLERWDQQREASNDPLSGSASPSGASSPAGKTLKPAMRRCETDFVSSEHHDVVAWLEIRELAASGHYVPAEVPMTSSAEAGVFQLHQGLQRRIHLTLLHGSGKALPLKRISNLRMGLLRFMDGKGKISDPISLTEVDVTLPQGGQDVEYHADGTGQIAVSGLWDSSAHDSILLNRKTPSDQTVLVRMTWLAELETSDEPAAFSMDIGLRILERDARPASRLLGLFSSTRILTKTSSVYSLVLSPPVTRTSRDLWRLDTARKHVRGGEGLVNWMPRGVSLLYDFTRLKRIARNQADVQAVLAVLNRFGSLGQLPVTTATTTDAQRSLMGRCVDLWQKEMRARSDVGGLRKGSYGLTRAEKV
jgi:kinesin family protein 1